jgi:hypothetical protein
MTSCNSVPSETRKEGESAVYRHRSVPSSSPLMALSPDFPKVRTIYGNLFANVPFYLIVIHRMTYYVSFFVLLIATMFHCIILAHTTTAWVTTLSVETHLLSLSDEAFLAHVINIFLLLFFFLLLTCQKGQSYVH